MRISDWSSDVCSSDLALAEDRRAEQQGGDRHQEGDQENVGGAGRGENAEIENVGKGGADQAERRQRRPGGGVRGGCPWPLRSEEHTSELQSLMRISYAVFCLKKKTQYTPLSATLIKE